MRGVFKIGLVACLACAVMAACSRQAPQFNATDLTGTHWGGDYPLVNQRGVSARLSDYQGKVVAVFFGFTHCPDICSPTLMRLAAVRRQLGDAADDFQVVFITIDPEHDTPPRLAKFLQPFDPSFVGLTGPREEIDRMIKDYRLSVTPEHTAEGQPRFEHSGGVFVRGRDGRPRLYLSAQLTRDDIVHDLRLLMNDGA